MKRLVLLAMYYCLLQWLPVSRRVGGIPGRLRYSCCRRLFAHCGRNVNIERRAYFGTGSELRVGDHSGIGVAAKLSPHVVIGRNVLMGEDVLMLAQNHAYKSARELIGNQGYRRPEPIVVGDDAWIGSRAIILPGVHIGNGSVVGAGSVVAKTVEPYTVVAGNPARVIGCRE